MLEREKVETSDVCLSARSYSEDRLLGARDATINMQERRIKMLQQQYDGLNQLVEKVIYVSFI